MVPQCHRLPTRSWSSPRPQYRLPGCSSSPTPETSLYLPVVASEPNPFTRSRLPLGGIPGGYPVPCTFHSLLYFVLFSCYTPYKFGTWILGFELQVPIRVLGDLTSPRLVSAGCPNNAADFDLNYAEIVSIPAGGQPERSHPIGVPGFESHQGYVNATSQTSTF